jgi:VCBS repeat-containing protein
MSKSRSSARRRSVRAWIGLETLELRTLFNVTPASVVNFGSLAVDSSVSNQSQILVRFRPGATPVAAAVLNGTTLKSALPLVDNLWTVQLAPGVSVQSALAAYKSHPSVEYAQEDFRVHLAGPVIPNDPQFPSLWGMNNTGQTGGTPDADIDAPEAWAVTTGSSNTVIAVIDTGVDYNHADLRANMWVNPGEIPGNGIDDDGNGFRDDIYGADFVNNDGDPMDDHFHGTHVAGTLGAVGNNGIGVAGVNWTGRIMALKFLDAFGYGYTSGAIAALNYAVANGATISNNSWGGGPFDQGLYDAINAAGNAGHIFVAAAGNDGSNNDTFPFYPAGFNLPNIISVAATDHNDALASFSNYGSTSVDLAAPGVNVLSTTPGNTYGTYSGTSMATPHVTGVVALIRSQHPTWTNTQIKDQVLSSVDPLPSLAGKTVTGGRLNAATAVGVDFGPRVVAQSPSGSTNGSVSSLQFTFSEPIQSGTFLTDDIVSFTGPGGADLRSMITGVSGSGMTFTVSFSAPLTALGTYSMVIGPDIRDDGTNHNQMDQDRDGINGEIPWDRYTATFEINDELIFRSTDVPAFIQPLYTTISYLTIGNEYQGVTIADLNLQLNINYPEVYDLNLSLTSPQGTFVPLVWWNSNVYGPNFQNTTFDDQAALPIGAGDAPFTGSYQPDGDLSAVNGQGVVGTWSLRIDAYPFSDLFNSGYLTAWSLIVEPQGSSNRPPVAGNDNYSTNEDTPLTVVAPGVLANDSDPDGNPLTAIQVSGPSHGTLSLNANGSFTYTPNANYNGADSFTYRANDGSLNSNIATVSITVSPVNDAPVAGDDSAITSVGVAVSVPVLGNDSDPDGDTLTVASFTQGSHGAVTTGAGGALIYTPTANFTGTDTFNYTVSDGLGGTDTATVTVTVLPANRPPVAVDDNASTPEDVAVSILVLGNDSDPDGDTLTVASFTQGSHGAVTTGAGGALIFTPAANFSGADSFSYTISDGRGGTDTATVNVTITPVNDAPVASNDSYSTNEDTTLTIAAPGVLANDTDVEGSTLTAALVAGPSNGTLTLNANGSFTYTPNANYNGADSFTYRANDGSLNSNIATVSITVSPVNDAPVADNDSYNTNENTPLTIAAPGVLANDTDVEGSTLTAALVAGPSNGTLTLNANGSFTYTPNANFIGTDTFTYKARDHSLDSNVATVSITVQSLDYFYFSMTTGGTLGGVSFTDADILRLAIGANGPQFSLFFDGSDVGLNGNQTAEDIDAFAFLPNGSIIVSTIGPFSVPGPGGTTLTGAGEDLLQFWPTSLGPATAGTWEFFFDGSDVGLSGSNENIDAVAVLDDDRIVISTAGAFAANGVSGQDEDLIAFTGTLGSSDTSGTWEYYFNGTPSSIGLGEFASEDIDGLFVSDPDAPTLYFSTRGNFSVPLPGGTLTGANEDVFAFHPTSLGSNTTGAFDPVLTLDGSLYGLGGFDIDGFYLGIAPSEGLGSSGSRGLGGVTTVTASGNSSLGAFPSGGVGFREGTGSAARNDLRFTTANDFASIVTVQLPPAETEGLRVASPSATGGGAHSLPQPSASLLSVLDQVFAQRGPEGDTPSPIRFGRASGSMAAGGGLEDGLSEEALWASFTYTQMRTL